MIYNFIYFFLFFLRNEKKILSTKMKICTNSTFIYYSLLIRDLRVLFSSLIIPLNCKYLDKSYKLDETIVFEKNATLKTFLGVHYFSFKKDGLLSSRYFKGQKISY